MSSHVSAYTICVLLALSACRADDDDDRDSVSIDSIRAREGGVAATPTPSIGAGRTAVPNEPSSREDDDEPVLPPQVVSDGGLTTLFDAGPLPPFSAAPTDGGSDFGENLPDAVATPVGTPWPMPADLAE